MPTGIYPRKKIGRTPNVKCDNCNIGVYRRPWQLKKGLVFISCKKCLSIVKSQHSELYKGLIKITKGYKWSKETIAKRSGENNPSWKGGKPKCLDCAVELQFSYKSKRCRGCHTKYSIKENSANWRGGITSKNKLERIKFSKTVAKEIYKRDNYTCQLCGSQKDLQVDHIQSWAEYVELRFSMDNCRTLCMKCHYFVTFNKPFPDDIKYWGFNKSNRKELF